jgi:hypothetical protein
VACLSPGRPALLELFRREIPHVEENLHGHHVGPVGDTLPGRHHFVDKAVVVLVLKAELVAFRHRRHQVFVLKLRVSGREEGKRSEQYNG